MANPVQDIQSENTASSPVNANSALKELSKLMAELFSDYDSTTVPDSKESKNIEEQINTLLNQINSKALNLSDADKDKILKGLFTNSTVTSHLLSLAKEAPDVFNRVMNSINTITPKNSSLLPSMDPKNIKFIDDILTHSGKDIQDSDALGQQLGQYLNKNKLSESDLQNLVNVMSYINARQGGGNLLSTLDDLMARLGSNVDDISKNLSILSKVFASGQESMSALGFSNFSDLDGLTDSAKDFYKNLAETFGLDNKNGSIDLVDNPVMAIAMFANAISLFMTTISGNTKDQGALQTQISEMGINLAKDAVKQTDDAIQKKEDAEAKAKTEKILLGVAACILGPLLVAATGGSGLMILASLATSLVATTEGDKINNFLAKDCGLGKWGGMAVFALLSMGLEGGLAGGMESLVASVARTSVSASIEAGVTAIDDAVSVAINKVTNAVAQDAEQAVKDVAQSAVDEIQNAGATAINELRGSESQILKNVMTKLRSTLNPKTLITEVSAMRQGATELTQSETKNYALALLENTAKNAAKAPIRAAVSAALQQGSSATKEAAKSTVRQMLDSLRESIDQMANSTKGFTQSVKEAWSSATSPITKILKPIDEAINQGFKKIGSKMLTDSAKEGIEDNFARFLRLSFVSGMQNAGAFSGAVEWLNNKMNLGDSTSAQILEVATDMAFTIALTLAASGTAGGKEGSMNFITDNVMAKAGVAGTLVQGGAGVAGALSKEDMADYNLLMGAATQQQERANSLIERSRDAVSAQGQALSSATSVLTSALNELNNLKYSANDGE